VLEVYTLGSRHFLFSHGDRVASSQLHGWIRERLIIDLSELFRNMGDLNTVYKTRDSGNPINWIK
jgi:hypothetical protein